MGTRRRVATQHRCIWCKQSKAESEFNVEHVMPQGFGTFEHNLTLRNTVCEQCNSFFSRELEPSLTRDSLEGFDRYRYGKKATADFKSLGTRSTARVQMTQGPYAGAWGYAVPGEETLGTRLFPQIGFAASGEGPFEWFPLDELPTRAELANKGYSEGCAIRLCECTPEEAASALAAQGVSVNWKDTFEPPSGKTEVDLVFRQGVVHRRALAKIALNYVAHQFGAEVALQPRFDPIRELVMNGSEPSFKYYDADDKPIIDGDKRNGKCYLGHAIVVSATRGGGIEVVVTLFNRFRHGFLLAENGGEEIESRGHFFDTENRVIRELARS